MHSLQGRQASRKLPRLVDQRVRYSLVLDELPAAPARVCELGVGHGWLAHTLHDAGYDVHGCDVDVDAFLTGSPLKEKIIKTSGAALPFPESHFDATYSCDAFEHVYPAEREAFLSEMIRVTKPGGVVALTAFFHNTVSFRLWGAGHLVMNAQLPEWYLDHITIPLPDGASTLAFFNRNLTAVRHVRYQRGLNLFVMWLQTMADSRTIAGRLTDLAAVVTPACDLIGRATSEFFVGRKR